MPITIESPHPYPTNYYNEWMINQPMAGAMRVHFYSVSVESGYDFVYIMDENNNIYETITGSHSDYWSKWVPGSVLKIALSSDYIINWWGFLADAYEWAYAADYVEMSAWYNDTGSEGDSSSFSYTVHRFNYMCEKYWFSMPYYEWSLEDITARVRIGFEVDVIVNGTLVNSTLMPTDQNYTLYVGFFDDTLIDIGDYKVTPSVNWITIQKGYTGIIEFTIASLGGYTSDLQFVIEGLPEGVIVAISNETFTLPPGGTFVVTVEITVPEVGVAPGVYMFTVKVIDTKTGMLRIVTPLYLIVV